MQIIAGPIRPILCPSVSEKCEIHMCGEVFDRSAEIVSGGDIA